VNQQSNSKGWDITLLVAVIRSELKLKPIGGWNITSLQPSKGAFVYLIRNFRNEIKHGSINKIDTSIKFTSFWNRIEFILKGISYKNLQFFYNLKTDPLDRHSIAITKTVSLLEVEVDNLSNMATDNSKDIVDIKRNIDSINLFLKELDDKKTDKDDLKGIIKYFQ